MRGYYGRKGDTVIKLAMIMSASKSDSFILESIDFTSALNLLNDNEQYLNQLASTMGQTEEGKQNNKVLEIISIAVCMIWFR